MCYTFQKTVFQKVYAFYPARKGACVITALLARLFIKNRDDVSSPAVRRAYGYLCGFLGIALNLLLFAFKLFAGTVSGSIAVTADAFNNLSDAGSSIITLLGFKLAGQKPDPAHPFGHGRIEYLSGLLVSGLIVIMGLELLQSSVRKIFSPEPMEFSVLSVCILAVSVAVKLYMCFYNRRIGARISSAAMKATAADSLSDCVATSVVLVSLLIYRFTGFDADAYCGLAVALFILVAGVRSAKETISPLLGQKPDPALVSRIESIVLSYPQVTGLHDLVVHDYGPGRLMISLHAEVSAKADICETHDAVDNIERRLAGELGCTAVIHMDPVDADDARTRELKAQVTDIIAALDPRLSLHDFRLVTGPTHTNVIFDLVVPFEVRESDEQLVQEVQTRIKALDSTLFPVIQVDRSMV